MLTSKAQFRTHPEMLELLGTGALLIRPEAVGGPLPLLPATRQDSLAVVGHGLAFVKDREGRLDGQQQARLARPQVLFVSNPWFATLTDAFTSLQANKHQSMNGRLAYGCAITKVKLLRVKRHADTCMRYLLI
jgi:hypothetical protein